MNTRELLEMTVLDSMGLLEPHEQESFERAFASAPASIREHVRFEQARLADLTDLLPDVSPRPEVRGLVLDAVRQAMAEREAAGVAENRRSSHAAGRSVPRLSRGPRVSWVWRAATIGLTVAVAVLGVALTQYQMDFNRLENNIRMAQLEELIGVEHFDDVMFDKRTRRAILDPVDPASPAIAAVVHNPDRSTARLYHKNVGADLGAGTFRLVVLDENDNVVREVATFASEGRRDGIDVQVDLLHESRLGLLQVSQNQDDRLLLRCQGLITG